MSDTGTISQELINKVAEELATLRRERKELRKALSDLLLVGEHRDLMQGLTTEQLFPHRFKAAREVLAKTTQQDLPPHLRDDTPYVVCSKCGRKSWGGNPVGSMCALSKPSGGRCDGIFDRQRQ